MSKQVKLMNLFSSPSWQGNVLVSGWKLRSVCVRAPVFPPLLAPCPGIKGVSGSFRVRQDDDLLPASQRGHFYIV